MRFGDRYSEDERREVAPQPVRERHREALLRALHHLARHVLVQDAAHQVLGPERSAAQVQRKAQRELHQAMVEQRLAAFEPRGHRGAVDLGEMSSGRKWRRSL
jgi:hypothetical protein